MRSGIRSIIIHYRAIAIKLQKIFAKKNLYFQYNVLNLPKQYFNKMLGSNIHTLGQTTSSLGMVSYDDVMSYLHSVNVSNDVMERVGQRLIVEYGKNNISKAYQRLNELAKLGDGWDGYGAYAIAPEVIANVRNVIELSDDGDWAKWLIFPSPQGALMLQSKKNRASISIGVDEFSYYALVEGKRMTGDHIAFDASLVCFVMRRIGR